MKEEDGSGNVPLERQVRRCPICNEADGTMVNYSLAGGEFMMHSICAARHFQQALRNIDWGAFPGIEYRNGEAIYARAILEGNHLPEHDA